MQFEAENALIGVKALSEHLAISTRTLHRILKSGTLPSILLGRRRLVRRSALETWLSGMTEQNGNNKREAKS